MTEIQATLLSVFIGSIIGAISTYIGAIRISDRERQRKIFNDTAEALRNALIKTQQRLESTKENCNIIKEDFLIHDEMARRFQLCITDKESNFTTAWQNYKYWYDNLACQGTTNRLFPEKNPLKDTPEFQQALKAKPIELIQKIIEHTKHK